MTKILKLIKCWNPTTKYETNSKMSMEATNPK